MTKQGSIRLDCYSTCYLQGYVLQGKDRLATDKFCHLPKCIYGMMHRIQPAEVMCESLQDNVLKFLRLLVAPRRASEACICICSDSCGNREADGGSAICISYVLIGFIKEVKMALLYNILKVGQGRAGQDKASMNQTGMQSSLTLIFPRLRYVNLLRLRRQPRSCRLSP